VFNGGGWHTLGSGPSLAHGSTVTAAISGLNHIVEVRGARGILF